MLAQDAGAGAGAADGDAVSIASADEFRNWRAAEQGREPQLIASREKNSACFLEAPQSPGFLAIPPRVEIHHGHVFGAEVLEELFVARPSLVHAARSGDNYDIGSRTARDAYEALQNSATVFLILGAADGYDPTAGLALGNFTWHAAESAPQRRMRR